MIQGSEEWILARVGSLGASRVQEVISRTKGGYGASRANLMAELIAERLTGMPAERFVSDAMAHGTETEPLARAAYELRTGASVTQVGLILHPTIAGTHASPDGLVLDDGLVEIKAPSTKTHIETLLTGAIPQKYVTQMTWQLICTGREWCDFASFDPRMPESMRLFIRQVPLDRKFADELETEVRAFLVELDAKLAMLNTQFARAA